LSLYKSQGRTHHKLVSYWGAWNKVYLAMFTAYVDDSGTDPNQAVAIASAWIIPGRQIIRLEKEWDTLKKKVWLFVLAHLRVSGEKQVLRSGQLG
jgi:hypothetical protein